MINEKERVYFRVTEWDVEKQNGRVVDKQRFEYPIDKSSLASECAGLVVVGDVLSGFVVNFETLRDLIIEEGSKPVQLAERKEFDSVGPSEAKGWEPRGTPHNALNGGRSDTGDSRGGR